MPLRFYRRFPPRWQVESHARRSRIGGANWLDGNFVRTLLSRLRKHRTEYFDPRFTFGRVGGNVTSQRTKWRQGCGVIINLNKHGRDSPYSLDRALPNCEPGTVFAYCSEERKRSPARWAVTSQRFSASAREWPRACSLSCAHRHHIRTNPPVRAGT